ncbi:hypothetical protein RJT34_08299 [Clitoria ternatea]|uniref:Uncharacterized protein n=1 Tax=Clitoria ternatea TaxID=43366 RepID=A0AAN9K6D3_CLITE
MALALSKGSSNSLKRATEYLIENSRIGLVRKNCGNYPILVNLNTQTIFDSLVNLYATVFTYQWRHFAPFMEAFTPEIADVGATPQVHAARCYISIWFMDLYSSIHESVKKVSCSALIGRYHKQLFRVSHEYDNYLSLLNASIKPTRIKNTPQEGLYIPIIATHADVTSPNPFGILNFNASVDLFFGLFNIIKGQNLMKMTPLSTDPHGRPCWLFDWHEEKKVCAWFHPEGNFDYGDVTLNYILGIPCTPNLGPRDVDDWQLKHFSFRVTPDNVIVESLQRLTVRRFQGCYDVRTLEIDRDYVSPNAKKQRTEKEKSETEETDDSAPVDSDSVARFRLIDWTYYHRVVLNMEKETRTDAHIIINRP